MFRFFIAGLTLTALTACGGTRYASSNAQAAPAPAPIAVTPSAAVLLDPVTGAPLAPQVPAPQAVTPELTTPAVVPLPFATGPIYAACQADGRKAASRARCGCVQAVADQSLSNADQKRGTKYFKDPAALQEVRQSDNPGNERFWLAWKAFGQSAVERCKGS